jgi:hypothetical protein
MSGDGQGCPSSVVHIFCSLLRELKRTKINKNSFVEAKGEKEQKRKGWGIGIRMCLFLEFALLYLEKNQESESLKIKHSVSNLTFCVVCVFTLRLTGGAFTTDSSRST